MAAAGDERKAAMSLGLTLTEAQAPGLKRQIMVEEVFFQAKSQFQENAVVRTAAFGRALFMDKQIQSSEIDEFIYHESLVGPAMTIHPNPKRIFIGGGGEFATAREVLKHKGVEECVMVDIDEEACKICIEKLPTWHDGCVSDKRLEVVYGDAMKYMFESKKKFDVVIMDIADPVEAGPGYKLYTKEFYEHVAKNKLNPGGVIVTQSTAADIMQCRKSYATIHNTLKSAFDNVFGYSAEIISFGGAWGFNIAWNKHGSLPDSPFGLSVGEVDKRIKEKYSADAKETKFYDGVTHQHLFHLPKYLRKALADCTAVSTIENPCYMGYGALET